MLSTDDFEKRANALFESCRTRWKAKLQKGLPKNVKIDIPPENILPFSRRQFQKWLWTEVGLHAVLCCYCRAPIDILSLSLDHKTPLRRGGGPEMQNLNPLVCKGCNGSKGQFTHEEYSLLVLFMEGVGASFRQRLEGVLRNGEMASMTRFFPREKGKKKSPTKTQDSLYFSDLPDF